MILGIPQFVYIFLATWIGETFGTMFGGGSFMIQPALIAAGVHPAVAVANDVTAATFATVAFLWFYRKQPTQLSRAQFRNIAIIMGPALIVGAICGGYMLQSTPENILKWFVLAICTVGLSYTVIQIFKPAPHLSLVAKDGHVRFWHIWVLFAGLAIGFYNGFSGAGSGVLMILALSLIFRLNMKTVLPLANLMNFISLVGAGFTFFYYGLLDWRLLAVMMPAAFLGGAFGAKIAAALPEKVLRVAYAVLVFALMLYLLKDMV